MPLCGSRGVQDAGAVCRMQEDRGHTEEMTFLCGFKSAGRVVSDWPICKMMMMRLRHNALQNSM